MEDSRHNSEEALPFFSIIVPAHNEAAYLDDTLTALVSLAYPNDRYEVIVVENGSTDTTYTIASTYAEHGVRTLSVSQKGVAHARWHGAQHCSPESTWCVFLDADTILDAEFLMHIDRFLLQTEGTYTVGTFAVQPITTRLSIQSLFLWTNMWRSFTKVPYTVFAIQTTVVRNAPLPDVTQQVGEDVALCRAAGTRANTFFLATNTVRTSVRRFEEIGWIRMLLYWVVVMPLPRALQRRLRYSVVR